MTLTNKTFQPLDRTALSLIVVLSLAIGLLLWNGDHSAPRVRNFSWQERLVGAKDTAFTLTFSRPMNQKSVEENLTLKPLLPGKFSWSGRRMAYTLLEPAPYGNQYQVNLSNAKDSFVSEGKRASIQPFDASFRTRDRAFAYIGVNGEERGRLILYNVSQQQKTALTPPDIVVTDFKAYPDGDRLLFSAASKQNPDKALLEQQLYTVTTGLSFATSPSGEPSGKLDKVLDAKDYQNLQFDLSADGKTIVVQRVNRRQPAQFGPWVLQPNVPPRPLGNQPGGDFLIAPDSSSLAITQGQGVAILPLTSDTKPLDFLPKFGMILNFDRVGGAAAMVKFNTDYTRSLYYVNNQGIQKELLKTEGSILSCEFAPSDSLMYCLLTQLIKTNSDPKKDPTSLDGEDYQEQPFLAAIDLKTAKVTPLLVLPDRQKSQFSLSPDGLALLFDQIATTNPTANDQLRTSEGSAIATGVLWLLPTTSTTPKPEQLPLPGFHPLWLP